MGLSPSAGELRGWTPIRIEWEGSQPLVDWCFSEGIEFTDPSFDDTVRRCFRNPARLLFRQRTTMAEVEQVAATEPGLAPAGMIFHSSRCGSTLVGQMLCAIRSVQVMAEPSPLDSILGARRVDPTLSEEQQMRWLRALVSVLGRPACAEQRHYVLKLDAWSIIDLPLLQRAFPDTPWIFLYRDPIEVLTSQLSHRGFHMVPGCLSHAQLGVDDDDDRLATLAPEEFCAAVLGRLYQCGLSGARGDPGRLVNYRELPAAVVARIAPLFGIEVSESDRSHLDEAAGLDAKNPLVAFTGVGRAALSLSNEEVCSAAKQRAYPAYDALELLRVSSR
jgi:hypothetical protein